MGSSNDDEELHQELSAYTLTRQDPAFIHQYVVDAWAAQHADSNTKPITLTFALVGLYLCVAKNTSGKNVQRVHMLLARRRKQWPTFHQPENRGAVTVRDVMAAPPGHQRDAMIRTWCESVWQAYAASHAGVRDLLQAELG